MIPVIQMTILLRVVERLAEVSCEAESVSVTSEVESVPSEAESCV